MTSVVQASVLGRGRDRLPLKQSLGSCGARDSGICPAPLDPRPLLFDNGFGGLTAMRYRSASIATSPSCAVANVVGERPAAVSSSPSARWFHMAENIPSFRLTPCHNGPLRPGGRRVYLRKENG